MTLRKWYFAVNGNALAHSMDQVSLAVQSAQKNTTLTPICLVDSRHELGELNAQVKLIASWGVTIVRHAAELFPLVAEQFGPDAEVFSGHWLRADIPSIEQEDPFVLYTDIDVMFRADPAKWNIRPPTIACCVEHWRGDRKYFNTGVMVMNLQGMRDTRNRLRGTLLDRLTRMAPHDDQGMFNVCYRSDMEWMPDEMNWKPYWGVFSEAQIVHFHGPKPQLILEMLNGVRNPAWGPEMVEVFERNPEAYRHYLREAHGYVPDMIAAPPGTQPESASSKRGWFGTRR